MIATIGTDGTLQCLYTEELDLDAFGEVSLVRGSHVEPFEGSQWIADMSPVGGGVLGPFPKRSQALAAEVEYLERKLLGAA